MNILQWWFQNRFKFALKLKDRKVWLYFIKACYVLHVAFLSEVIKPIKNKQ